jgi:hypothetical protein
MYYSFCDIIYQQKKVPGPWEGLSRGVAMNGTGDCGALGNGFYIPEEK